MRFLGFLWSTPEILQLTKDNFSVALRTNRNLLVNFYSPKCKFCVLFKPEYEKVAYALQKKDIPVTIGQLDATVESSIATEQGINRYPTIKLFRNTVPIKYDGPQEASKLIQWLEKRVYMY